MYGTIEAGGTKFVCSVGNSSLEIIDKEIIPTTYPAETMAAVSVFFEKYKDEIKGISIGSFGPIDINRDSNHYGFITTTPKVGWEYFNFVDSVKQILDVPIVWTTDVNVAAYGEYKLGAGKDYENIVYFTVGTGIGGSAILKGEFLEGITHPEMGHMKIKRHPDDNYSGKCSYHNDCLEGLASGPAIQERMGIQAQNIDDKDTFWDIEAYYLAQAAYNIALVLSPDVIIFGGGVMKQNDIFNKVRENFSNLMNEYVDVPSLNNYIVPPELGDDAGTIGCIALIRDSL